MQGPCHVQRQCFTLAHPPALACFLPHLPWCCLSWKADWCRYPIWDWALNICLFLALWPVIRLCIGCCPLLEKTSLAKVGGSTDLGAETLEGLTLCSFSKTTVESLSLLKPVTSQAMEWAWIPLCLVSNKEAIGCPLAVTPPLYQMCLAGEHYSIENLSLGNTIDDPPKTSQQPA